MNEWRIWHSAKAFAEYVVDHTELANLKGDNLEFKSLPESDANNPKEFHKIPDHIKKILYLDAPDIIIERNQEPVLCIECTLGAGTGHAVFQRFSRIVAAIENKVPAIYIQPEGKIVTRKTGVCWDRINPIIFWAYKKLMRTFGIPALIFYYSSDFKDYENAPQNSPHVKDKGIVYHEDSQKYLGCPKIDSEMQKFFKVVNAILSHVGAPAQRLMRNRDIEERIDWMDKEYYTKAHKELNGMSPITATITIETQKLLDYLKRVSCSEEDVISELLISRPETVIYQCDIDCGEKALRGDPYSGVLCALDYLLTRNGETVENRTKNLVLCFGKVKKKHDAIHVNSTKSCSINDFIKVVSNANSRNLLNKQNYSDLKRDAGMISRYYMQVRHGSTYSKVKLVRVFSHFADALIFKDGALWRA